MKKRNNCAHKRGGAKQVPRSASAPRSAVSTPPRAPHTSVFETPERFITEGGVPGVLFLGPRGPFLFRRYRGCRRPLKKGLKIIF